MNSSTGRQKRAYTTFDIEDHSPQEFASDSYASYFLPLKLKARSRFASDQEFLDAIQVNLLKLSFRISLSANSSCTSIGDSYVSLNSAPSTFDQVGLTLDEAEEIRSQHKHRSASLVIEFNAPEADLLPAKSEAEFFGSNHPQMHNKKPHPMMCGHILLLADIVSVQPMKRYGNTHSNAVKDIWPKTVGKLANQSQNSYRDFMSKIEHNGKNSLDALNDLAKYALFLQYDNRSHTYFFGKSDFRIREKGYALWKLVNELALSKDVIELEQKLDAFYKGQNEDNSVYKILNTGQNVTTRLFGFDTTSIKKINALRDVVKSAKQSTDTVIRPRSW